MVILFYFFLAFFLPFIWILYFAHKDKNPEPKKWLFLAFLLGIFSAFLSYYCQKLLFQFMDSKSFTAILLSVISEEFFKFIVIWVFIYPQKVFDELIDAMIYMMFSALGFAFTENLAFLLRGLDGIEIILILFFRFLGANLLHILASCLVGYGYALWKKTKNYLVFPIFFLLSVGLHFLYNYFIINLNFFLVLPILWTALLVVLSELNSLSQNGRRREEGRNINP